MTDDAPKYPDLFDTAGQEAFAAALLYQQIIDNIFVGIEEDLVDTMYRLADGTQCYFTCTREWQTDRKDFFCTAEHKDPVSPWRVTLRPVGSQLGQFESGVVAALIGAVGSVFVGGVAALGVVAIWMRKFPAITNIEHPEEDAVP